MKGRIFPCEADRDAMGRTFRVTRSCIVWACIACALTVPAAPAQVFRTDDPITSDPDRLDIPAPAERNVGDLYDFWEFAFRSPGAYDGPALNANTLGDVPASSWYTPRHYLDPMSEEELSRGPDQTGGPSPEGAWRVVAAKTEGASPGLEIVDARGDRYVVKFDPPGHVELMSGAEVISTKILFALGYHVPENYAVRFRRDRLVAGIDTGPDSVSGDGAVTDAHIDDVLRRSARYEDGSYRALASKVLEGTPIGPFSYYGTRPDDGNDIFPHEARRELRGLRVAASWINHTDARTVNTLDVVVSEDGRQFVRHFLIDFGSTLGAAPFGPRRLWDGFEYMIDGRAILRRVLTLGVAGLEWAAIEYPTMDAVGHFEAEHFHPPDWRTQSPNPAFVRCDAADAFWAAKQIALFSDEAVRAIVKSAGYTMPAAEARIAQVLIDRRDAIVRAYSSFGGGLDRFTVESGVLSFEDLPARHGLSAPGRLRHVVWRSFDNEQGEAGAILRADPFRGTSVEIPRADAAFLMAEIRTPGVGATRVVLRSGEEGRSVAGVEREAF